MPRPSGSPATSRRANLRRTALVNYLGQTRRVRVLRLEGAVLVDLDGHVALKVGVRGRDCEARVAVDVVLVGLRAGDLLLLQPVEVVVRDEHVHGNVRAYDHLYALRSGGVGRGGRVEIGRASCRERV